MLASKTSTDVAVSMDSHANAILVVKDQAAANTNKRYGVSRLRIAAESRIEREKAVTNNRQELLSYLADPLVEIKDDVDDFDLIKWWKVSIYLLLFTTYSSVITGQCIKVPCLSKYGKRLSCHTGIFSAMRAIILECRFGRHRSPEPHAQQYAGKH